MSDIVHIKCMLCGETFVATKEALDGCYGSLCPIVTDTFDFPKGITVQVNTEIECYQGDICPQCGARLVMASGARWARVAPEEMKKPLKMK